MTKVAFSNIQRRSFVGTLIGIAPDVTLDVSDPHDLDAMSETLRLHLGDGGMPSFTYEQVAGVSMRKEFMEYVVNEGLPGDHDAEELLRFAELTPDQRTALVAFCERWNVATEKERWG